MLIQSSLIIAGEVGIIIASGLGLAPTSSVGKRRGEREREKKSKGKRGSTGGASLAARSLIDGLVATFIIRARRFRLTVRPTFGRPGDSPRIDPRASKTAAAAAALDLTRISGRSSRRAREGERESPREKTCDFTDVVPLRCSILISVLSVCRADATCYRGPFNHVDVYDAVGRAPAATKIHVCRKRDAGRSALVARVYPSQRSTSSPTHKFANL
jgi:hypothetical protein